MIEQPEHEKYREPRNGGRLIFVGGCPRSGTTLLQSMLDSHPDICGGPEFDLIPEIIELRGKLRASISSGRTSAYHSEEGVDRATGAFIERLLLPYAKDRDCKVVSEKTPWNVLVFRELLEVFPEARFIFCVRDSRAVTTSMIEVGKRAQERGLVPSTVTMNVPAIIKTTKSTNKAGFDAAGGSDHVLIVVYERLITDPGEETRRICNFLGIPWSDEMTKPGEKQHDGGKVLDGVWHYPEMHDGNPDSGRANRWQDQLTPTEKAMVNTAFDKDKNLMMLGYRFLGNDLPLTKRAAGKMRSESHAIASSGLSLLLATAKRIPAVKKVGVKLLSQIKETQERGA